MNIGVSKEFGKTYGSYEHDGVITDLCVLPDKTYYYEGNESVLKYIDTDENGIRVIYRGVDMKSPDPTNPTDSVVMLEPLNENNATCVLSYAFYKVNEKIVQMPIKDIVALHIKDIPLTAEQEQEIKKDIEKDGMVGAIKKWCDKNNILYNESVLKNVTLNIVDMDTSVLVVLDNYLQGILQQVQDKYNEIADKMISKDDSEYDYDM